MKKLLYILLILAAPAAATVAAVTAATAAASAPAAAVRVPDASLGSASYNVRYRLAGITTKVATATITFEESEREGRPAYHASFRIVTEPFFRLFLKAEYKADAWYSRDDLSPLYFVHPFKDGKKDGKYEVFYDYLARTVRSVWAAEGKEPVDMTYPIRDRKAMDLLSALVFMRFHEFKENTPEPVFLLMPSHARDAEIILDGDRLALRITGAGVMENGSGNTIFLWLSSAPDRNILRLETELSSGSLFCTIHQQ